MKTQWDLSVDAVAECAERARADRLKGRSLHAEVARLVSEHNLSSAIIRAGLRRAEGRRRREARQGAPS